MITALTISRVIEETAKDLSGLDAELYDFGGGCTVAPVPDKQGFGFLTDFMFAVCNYSEAKTKENFRFITCEFPPDITEEELSKKVKDTFEKFRNIKTQEKQ